MPGESLVQGFQTVNKSYSKSIQTLIFNTVFVHGNSNWLNAHKPQKWLYQSYIHNSVDRNK